MTGFFLVVSLAFGAPTVCPEGPDGQVTLDDVRVGLHDLGGALDSRSEDAVRDRIQEVQRRLSCLGERLPSELPLLPELFLMEAYDAFLRREELGPSSSRVVEGMLGAALALDPSTQLHEMFGLEHPLRQRLEVARSLGGAQESFSARLPKGEALLVNGRDEATRQQNLPVLAQVVRRTQKSESVVWTGIIPPTLDAATWCRSWPADHPICPDEAP